MRFCLFINAFQATTFSMSTNRTANAPLVNIHLVVPHRAQIVQPVITVAVQPLHALNAAAATTVWKVRQAARCVQLALNLRLEHQPARLVTREPTAVVVRVQCLVVRRVPRESTRVVLA